MHFSCVLHWNQYYFIKYLIISTLYLASLFFVRNLSAIIDFHYKLALKKAAHTITGKRPKKMLI